MKLGDFIKNAEAAKTGAGEIVRGSMKALQVIAVAGMRSHFVEQRGPDGKAWGKLAHPRPDGGEQVLRDKGLLYNSLGSRITGEQLVLFASHPGANIHNFGGILTPKKARALAIPLTREAKRAGSPRQNGFPRPLFLLVSKNRKAFLAERAENGGLVFHYILVRSVRIPKREFVGFSEKTLDKMEAVLASRLMDKLASAFDPKVFKMTRQRNT